jgi:hypothetical protein
MDAACADGIAIEPLDLEDIGPHIGEMSAEARRAELRDFERAYASQEIVAAQA